MIFSRAISYLILLLALDKVILKWRIKKIIYFKKEKKKEKKKKKKWGFVQGKPDWDGFL